ncbi:MAG: AAA domain-containing protein [Metamycoplasmataceae bacterium]
MEFKILKFNKKDIYSNQTKQFTSNKYEKILANLLAINNSDSAIFTKINSFNKDLNKILSNNDISKIWTKNEFRIKLNKILINDLGSRLNKVSNDPEEIIKILNETDFNITILLKNKIYKNPLLAIDEIMDKVGTHQNQFITKWKKYQKSIRDSFEQTNIWPLFIGTYFISGTLIDKQIFAPFLLKEIEIEINDNNVYLVSKNDSVVLNDKLIFFMQKGLDIETPYINSDLDKISINELSLELDYYFKEILEIPFVNMTDVFVEKKIQDISHSILKKEPGIVLINCHPSGGTLRAATVDLIESGKIDDLLHIDNLLTNFEEKAIKSIIEDNMKIVRVCPTDASQEKAIIASLQNHTIIIGPPGTGKSQTIANLLANILNQNKTALFISQKKVALEVVINRMGQLSNFLFQLVETHNKTSKQEKAAFYSRLKDFINHLKFANENSHNNIMDKRSFISNEIRQYWRLRENVNERIDDNVLNRFQYVLNRLELTNIQMEDINKTFHLFEKLKYSNNLDKVEHLLDLKERDIYFLAIKMNINVKKYFGIIKIYPKDFKTLYEINISLLNLLKIFNDDVAFILCLKEIETLEKFNLLFEFNEVCKNKIKTTNKFISDEDIIKHNVSEFAKNKYVQIERDNKMIDKTWSKKFLGRIERSYTIPTNFTYLFKDDLKRMFNVFVSTPESLAGFIDFKKDKYDYVIFDEASQIFLEKALPFISIGSKIIIAGDDQQMQPSNWFSTRVDDENDEIESIDSLLSYAIANYIPKYNLELNYRSNSAELTTFSSKQFYESNLKTLDKNNFENNSIEIVNVNGQWENNTNLKEANEMINILKNNWKSRLYKKIILLTLNKKQMDLVNDLLASNEPQIYDHIISGKIILKNLENIQGDEADLVIVSIAYTKDASLASTYVCRPGGKNALNVAITRAKSKMIVLKSINSNEISSNSDNANLLVFKSWLEFLELKSEQRKEYSIKEYENNISVGSGFELDVFNWLKLQKLSKDVELCTQYPIGSYRIDLALINRQSGRFLIGIEVDGLRYHSTTNQKYNDIIRQDFIESKGYKIIRISEMLWKTNKESILKMIEENY